MGDRLKKNVPVLRFPEFEGNWQTKTLEELADWSSGGTPSKDNPDYWGGDIPWISASSMYYDILSDSENKITDLGLKNGSRLAPKGSILILVRGSMLYNRVPIGIAGRDLAFNQDVKALKFLDNREIKYLFYWLKAQENFLKAKVTGTGIGAGKLDTSELKELIVLKPPIAEQEKIASFLGSIDTRITQLRCKHELLQTYKRGVMQKLFSQQIRFKGDDGHPFPDWEKKRLEAIFSEFKSGYNITSDEITESGSYPVFGGNGIRGYSEKFTHDGFYFLIGRQGALCGNIHRSYGKAYISEHAIACKANDTSNTEWLAQRLNHYNLNKMSESSAQPGLAVNKLLRFKLLTPRKEEQEKIVDFLTAIDQKIEAVAKQIELTEQFKKGLLQKMFV